MLSTCAMFFRVTKYGYSRTHEFVLSHFDTTFHTGGSTLAVFPLYSLV